MPRRRPKKIARIIHLSAGPLPATLAARFSDAPLLFSDASLKRHGGLAVALFANQSAAPIPVQRTVPVDGSNELELQATLLGLESAQRYFPGQDFVLFSDNQDAVLRLNRAKELGLEGDPMLAQLLAPLALTEPLARARILWIKGHGRCRGNHLADELAVAAAS